MKLSVITDELTQDFERALDIMQEYQVNAAELRGLWGTNIIDLDTEQVKRAKSALSDRGMTVSCLSSPFYKCDIASEDTTAHGRMHLASGRALSEQMEMLRRLCGLAHEVGTELIRVFSFWRQGDLTPELEDRIATAFTEPVRIAAEEGVILALENEHACFLGTGAETARVLSAVNSPQLRACWDPGNAFFAGERPFPDGYEAMKPYLVHFHIKDAAMEADGRTPRWTVVGEGDIDYVGHIAALRRDNYQGYISLETHYVPAGGTPEEGSRACLSALNRLLKD